MMRTYDYIRDPAAIYRRSFELIEQEAVLDRFGSDERTVAIRMIHACGIVDIDRNIHIAPGAVRAGIDALRAGSPIYCDARMVAEGIIRSRLPASNRVVCDIAEPELHERAKKAGTTRSAVQVLGWELEGSIVVIGNAPTALFALLESVSAGKGRPALVIGVPVGFVGAVEAKDALYETDLPFVTLLGRIGGSAIAAAALNAVAGLAAVR